MSLDYDCIRYGRAPNDWRLVPRGPIQTRDSKDLSLFGRERRVRSRDEILESQNSGRIIGLGKVWTGAGVNPELDEKTASIRDFVSGFVPGNVVHAEDPGKVISLGRVYLPEVQDEERREALARAMDEAEAEWKKDERSGHGPAADKPVTTDSATTRSRLFGGGKATPASQYADSLRKGRETSDRGAPAKVANAADYARNLAAARRAKGAA